MPDFSILEQEGWIEITDLAEEILSSQVIDELWEFIAEDQVAEAVDLVDRELGSDLESFIGTNCVQNVMMVDLPGKRTRIWVRR